MNTEKWECYSSHCKKKQKRVPTVAQRVKNLTSIHRDTGSIPGLARSVKVKDPVLLWLWPRPAPAAPIQALAWEFPHAAGAAVKKKLKKKKKEKKKNKRPHPKLGEEEGAGGANLIH